MYDIVKCKISIEGMPEVLFQTRDLKCLMNYYTIRTDGKLIHHDVVHQIIPEEQRPLYGTPEWYTEQKARAVGSLKQEHTKNNFVDYEGELIFYVLLDKEYYEYRAIFRNDVCQEINKINRRIIPPWGLKGGEHLDASKYTMRT